MFGEFRTGRVAAAIVLSLVISASAAGSSFAQSANIDAPAMNDDPSPTAVAGVFDFLRRGPDLLLLPVTGAILTSGYGMRRNPFGGGSRLHAGIDLSAPAGTPIMAAGDGIVVSAEWENGYGYTTRILHQDGVETMYAHQSSIADWIAPGAEVSQGDIIGAIGTTGNATGPHLHYEVRINGQLVDPLGSELRQAALVSG